MKFAFQVSFDLCSRSNLDWKIRLRVGNVLLSRVIALTL